MVHFYFKYAEKRGLFYACYAYYKGMLPTMQAKSSNSNYRIIFANQKKWNTTKHTKITKK